MTSANQYQRRIGRRVLDARTAADLTQQQLADRVGLARSSIANIEAGRQAFDALLLAKFARALRVGMDALVTAEDLPPEPVPPVRHDVEVELVYQVTCRTCAPGQPIDVLPTRAKAVQARRDHVAEMLARENEEPS